MATESDEERIQWVDLLKPEIETATRKAAVVDASTAVASSEGDAGEKETLVDLIDSSEIWAVVSRKLGQDLLSKVRSI